MVLRHLVFNGPGVAPARLDFREGPNLIWGASNTGKSFTLKAIDFMLGGSKPLPSIEERNGYDTILLGLSLTGVGDFTLYRAAAGGRFELFDGLIAERGERGKGQVLSADHDRQKDDNLSAFLLKNIGLRGKVVAKDSVGNKDSLSFRNVVKLSLVDEAAIQAERSPVESGQRDSAVRERSVFRLFLTGGDDSALVPLVDDKTFKASKATRLELLGEMLDEIDRDLEANHPNAAELPSLLERLESALQKMQSEFENAQRSVGALLKEKERLAREIPATSERLAEIEVHLDRFAQLDAIYVSDIERLEALEEAGFLLSLNRGRPCPLCGAAAEAQTHHHEVASVAKVRSASEAEVAKIKNQRSELGGTVGQLSQERERLVGVLPRLRSELQHVEGQIAQLAPKADEHQRTLREVIGERDRAREGVSLLERKNVLTAKRLQAEKLKKTSKKDKPKLEPPTNVLHSFGKVVSKVLTQWEFPGERIISFDEKSCDLLIDGKLRIDNGKGVRAITHAAFKVALLIYCHEHKLPHPGFVVLDTPLLTYRDPIRQAKFGALEADEKALAQSPLKQRFFEHLHALRHVGQFIVLENVDPPANIESLAKVETFHGDPGKGRRGLFP
jgi:predicted  nucleic acid-binding Zn-ribbon protein